MLESLPFGKCERTQNIIGYNLLFLMYEIKTNKPKLHSTIIYLN
jgi:hypothetical protein